MDQKKLKIAYHETGHAVMALIFRQAVQKISLKELESPYGTDKYHAFVKLEAVDPSEKFTGEKAIQKIMIALGGFASEILFSNGVAGVGGDDLTIAVSNAEAMLQDTEFKNWVSTLPVPAPGPLDMIENVLARAYVERKLLDCVERLDPLRPVIQTIANQLYQKEELSGEEVTALFNSLVRLPDRSNG